MILLIAKLLTRFFGLDISKAQRIVFWVLFGLIAIVVLFVVFQIKACFTMPAKLDEPEIQQGEQAKKDGNDKVLRDILTNSDVREKMIDANVANAEAEKVNAIYESRKKWEAANRDELQAEFDRRAKGQ